MSLLPLFLEKLTADGAPERICQLFSELYTQYQVKENKYLPWNELTPLSHSEYTDQSRIDGDRVTCGLSHLNELVMIKLNGGLGTSMRCLDPKALIEVMKSRTFLECTIHQQHRLNHHYLTQVPLLLMNSFYTNNRIQKALKETRDVTTFLQYRFPRIVHDTGEPLSCSGLSDQEWSPSGHGNIYDALYLSGILDQLLLSGKRIAFISNIDNLGATVDLRILGHFVATQSDFMMEITSKTQRDCKGGVVVKHNGQLTLLERAHVHPDYYSKFESVSPFSLFNTNSLWINLEALRHKMVNGGIRLPLIVNPKMVDGILVDQLETAMGAGLSQFDDPTLLVVDRSRFLPVKTTQDLLLMRSDLFSGDTYGGVQLDLSRMYTDLPRIEWDDDYYSIDMFNDRFKYNPSLKECMSLTLTGDFWFGPNVILKGDVMLCSDDREYLENCVIRSGF
jgi:UTP--glucose-1-phosphate uridylyltransferase